MTRRVSKKASPKERSPIAGENACQGSAVAHQDTLYTSRSPVRRYLHNRRRSLIQTMIKLHGRDAVSALDIGSGIGTYTSDLLQTSQKVTCADNDSALLEYIAGKFGSNPKLKLINADGTNLPFPENSFDLILCTEMLEHTPSPSALLREVARVKKPQGIFILSTPQKFSLPELTAKIFFSPLLCWLVKMVRRESVSDCGHISLQTASSLKNMLRQCGFRILYARYTGIFVPVVSEICGNWWVRLFQKQEKNWEKGILRPLLWTQYYVLQLEDQTE